jgi:hypothetical protein
VDNYTDNLMIERAVAIFGMLFWLAFPIGMMISVIKQDHDAHHGHSKDVDADHESAYGPDYKKTA